MRLREPPAPLFEELLQSYLCQPLGLKRTTYLPNEHEANVATAAVINKGRTVPYEHAPHALGTRLQLTLTGGSIYSTAREMAEFAEAVIGVREQGSSLVVSKRVGDELQRQQYANQLYGLGWSLTIRDGEAVRMSHDGSLHGYHAWIGIDIENQTYVTAVWTDSNVTTRNDGAVMKQLRNITGVQ